MPEIRNEVFANGAVVAADIFDLAAGTYTREESGVVVESRLLTPDEIAAYTPTPPVRTPDERLDDVRAALATLNGLPDPVLAVEIADVLADVQTALEG